MTRLLSALAGFAIAMAPAYARAGETPVPLSLRITSPLGRTGMPGPIRLVAQVKHAHDVRLQPVKFFVDGHLQGEAIEGPPFAVEWSDDNPYEPREISAEVCDEAGECARDLVKLEPRIILEETDVSSVLVEAAVLDATGKSVNGLITENFALLEDDVPQTLDLVRSDAVDSTYVLLVHLPSRDRVLIAPFSRKLEAVTGPTNDRATAIEAIGAIRSHGGTAIMDVLTDLPKLVEGTSGRLAVVLITDGYDEHSSKTTEDAIRAVKSAQATLFVVGIGGVAGISLKGERLLRTVAEQSGGRAFFPSRDEDLDAAHGMIAADIQSRYLLAYTPTNRQLDGGWRRIHVTTTSATNVVRARPGYFAPKPPPVRATLEFTVANRDHRPVEVTADDLEVFEDGVKQTLESFQEALSPISIVLAVDASGSMKAAVDAVKDGARQFVEALRPQDRLATIVFSDESVLIHDLTERRDATMEAIDQYQVHGGTALNDALFDALKRLGPVEGRRAIVVLTDGRDENGPGTGPGSRHTRDEVLKELRTVDATIYGIGLGATVDRDVLDELARASGGEAFFPETVQELSGNYRRVVDHLRRRYVATFLSSNTTRDGGWRAVEILSHDPLLAIRSRGGYFGPDR
jgi:VWFA-related protein